MHKSGSDKYRKTFVLLGKSFIWSQGRRNFSSSCKDNNVFTQTLWSVQTVRCCHYPLTGKEIEGEKNVQSILG